MQNSRAAAAAKSFFGQSDRVGQTFCFGKLCRLEFVLVLVVVARIAAADDRLLVRVAQNFFVSRSELKIYHRMFLVVIVGKPKLRPRLPAPTPCACRDTTSRPGYRAGSRGRRASGRLRRRSTSRSRRSR